MATTEYEAPSLEWSEEHRASRPFRCWGRVRLPVWAGFTHKRAFYKNVRPPRGTAPVSVQVIVLGKEGPRSRAQECALDLLVRDSAVYVAVLQSIFLEYQAHGWKREDLHALVVPSSIHVLEEEREGVAYVGFHFSRQHKPGPDLVVLAHRARIVDVCIGDRTRGMAARDAASDPPRDFLAEHASKVKTGTANATKASKGPLVVTPARLEKPDSKASYVTLEIQGPALVIRTGKRGSASKEKTEKFGSNKAASAAFDQRRAALVADGYVDLTWLQSPGAMAKPGVSVSNPKLEAIIARNPADPDAYGAYADWLAQRGDPRADLIRAGLRLQQDPDDLRAERAAKTILSKFEMELYGPFADYKSIAINDEYFFVGFKWRMGFIRAARLWCDVDDPPLPERLAMLFDHPSGHLIEHISLVSTVGYEPALDVIASRAPATLRSLHLGEVGGGTVDIGRPLAWPNLHRLVVANVSPVIEGRLDVSQLEELVIEPIVEDKILSDEFQKAFARIRWPKLRTLEVPSEIGSGLDAILERNAAPSLRRLLVAEELLQRVAQSPIRTTLDELVIDDICTGFPTENVKRGLAGIKRVVLQD